ncbi:TPA: hypothetical protein N0F65_001186 [Lagenidium giganteum]|uniref:Cyclic nucleotide-binding domain-containing protein n=1 Tax=Lagenidium giganteum TaxID=4803 RepID=A0AAV2Z4U5_9STRA|nr:TPA: hypothetical protein N0F65_001186 [Lagenidium giganteum]
MERLRYSYNDVIVREGESAGSFYFVKHGECRVIKKYRGLKHTKQSCYVEIYTVGSRHYFGAYEIIQGEQNAIFSVLITSPSAILYRVDRVDFRQTILKDSVSEHFMRMECSELKARINEESVKQDLDVDVRWNQYKRQIVRDILSKHDREHQNVLTASCRPTSPRHLRLLVQTTPQSARRPDPPQTPKSPRARIQSSRAVTPTMIMPARTRMSFIRHLDGEEAPQPNKKWQEWARQRAQDIIGSSSAIQINEAEEVPPESSIQWGKSAKIMGGMQTEDDKITSAIVALFHNRGGIV